MIIEMTYDLQDKLMLKPFAGERNVCYVVVAPETDGVVKACRRFFTELSQMYEQCSLGRHTPYQHLRDGVLRVGRTLAPAINDKPISDWFKRIDALPHAAKLRLIAKICRHQLAPLLGQHGPDISSATPPSSQQTTGGAGSSQDNVFTKPQPRPSTPTATLLSPPAKDEGPKGESLCPSPPVVRLPCGPSTPSPFYPHDPSPPPCSPMLCVYLHNGYNLIPLFQTY